MRKTLLATAAVAAAAALSLGPVAASATDTRNANGKGLKAIGLLGDSTLVRFSLSDPGKADRLGEVKGLKDGDRDLIGIDYRVQDGKLYAVGRAGGVYSVSTKSLKASLVDTLDVKPSGKNFGVDFNPAANALRIVSDNGQNLRHSFEAGTTTADAALQIVAAPNPAAPVSGVTGAAYTNNDLVPTTATTLFDLATASDQVAIQSPANAGLLVATGATGVNLDGDTGFDIYTQLRNGKAGAQYGFAVDNDQLYSVQLLNGEFRGLGKIGGGKGSVEDIAIPLAQG